MWNLKNKPNRQNRTRTDRVVRLEGMGQMGEKSDQTFDFDKMEVANDLEEQSQWLGRNQSLEVGRGKDGSKKWRPSV